MTNSIRKVYQTSKWSVTIRINLKMNGFFVTSTLIQIVLGKKKCINLFVYFYYTQHLFRAFFFSVLLFYLYIFVIQFNRFIWRYTQTVTKKFITLLSWKEVFWEIGYIVTYFVWKQWNVIRADINTLFLRIV